MTTIEQTFGKLTATTFSPTENPKKALVLLHGVGSNDRDLFDVGPRIAKDRLIVSLRGPLALGLKSFAWFRVQFTPEGPIHQWNEAEAAFTMIEDAIKDLSEKSKIPVQDIAVMGFSQGAIMTIGLALHSKLNLEKYIASSGRTLPEFALESKLLPRSEIAKRKVYLSHGVQDATLPIFMGRNSEKVLKSAGVQLTYKEYADGHQISKSLIDDLGLWLENEYAE